jgi:hypothetical protein
MSAIGQAKKGDVVALDFLPCSPRGTEALRPRALTDGAIVGTTAPLEHRQFAAGASDAC